MSRSEVLAALTWAKYKGGDAYHPLAYHMVDVGMVAKLLWQCCFSKATKRKMSEAFLVEHEDEAQGIVAYLADCA
jgi:hypothetical protein